MTDGNTWRQATNLVVTDLEGTGESGTVAVMLEFVTDPLVNGAPSLASAFLHADQSAAAGPPAAVDVPGDHRPRPGAGPTLKQVTPKITYRLTGAYLIGHNIGGDWALLHRSCPDLQVAALIDTLVLARRLRGRSGGRVDGAVG